MSTNQTSKPMSERDHQQVLKGSYNDVDKSLTTSSFASAKIGNKITFTTTTTSVAGDTLNISYYDQLTTLLYTLSLVFTDSSQTTIISVTRIA